MDEIKTDAIASCIDVQCSCMGNCKCGARRELAALLAALHEAEAENETLRSQNMDGVEENARLRDKCSDAEECPLFYSEKNYQDAIAEAEKWKRGYDDGCDIITSLRAEVAAAEERVWRVARRLCANCYNMNEPFYGRDVADYKTYAAAKAAEAKENKK